MNLIDGLAQYLEKGVGVDHEDNAKVGHEVSREFGYRVADQACCLRN